MSLAYGRPMRAIPGPSIIPDRVLAAMHKPAPDIYAEESIQQTARIKADLQTVAGTQGEAFIYLGNGHAGWEAALSNTVNRGDRVLAIETGLFTKGWIDIGKKLGASVESLDFGFKGPLDPNRVEDVLRKDVNHEIRSILAVHVDTASSVRNDIPALRAAISAAGHPALLMVDCMASMGCETYEMDKWGVDVSVSGCQKGLMTPPGLAFNHVSEKAWNERKRCNQTTANWDWVTRRDPDVFYMNYFGTPPTHHLFGLAEALDMILREEGLENVWARHEAHAAAIWAAVDAWGANGPLACNIEDPAHRSHAVSAILTGDADANALRNWCVEKTGLSLGVDIGVAPNGNAGLFRIGHMGHLNPPMILGTLATIEAGLKALGTPHGDGAISAAAQVIAARA